VHAVRKVLEELGATIIDVKLPAYEKVMAAWGSICSVETAIAHETTYPSRADEYSSLKNLIEAGRAVSANEVMKAHHERLIFTGALSALFANLDLLLIPAQPRADFTLVEEAELFATNEGLANFLRYATPYDMSGHPTITMPGGFTEKGLPLAFQLVGK